MLGANRDGDVKLAARIGAPMTEPDYDFFEGTMFWARPKALAPLARIRLSADSFEPEAGRLDEATEDAAERIFNHVATGGLSGRDDPLRLRTRRRRDAVAVDQNGGGERLTHGVDITGKEWEPIDPLLPPRADPGRRRGRLPDGTALGTRSSLFRSWDMLYVESLVGRIRCDLIDF